ncbi:MAG: sulfite reductase subunit alpha, partial [Chthoniobacteraceae bacterium]
VAPFRAFVEERVVSGATGKNWLFFGEQREAQDFFYRDQFTKWASDGALRMDLAFSRDQERKIYVQHRMEERGADIWAWLQEGADFFVCGDKNKMAADVDAALHKIAETHGGKTPEQAKEFIDALKKEKRYKRDVY